MEYVPPFYIIFLTVLLGCAGEDKKSSGNSENPSGDGDNQAYLSGLWVGITEENTTTSTTPVEVNTHIIFVEDVAYVLREDEALVGGYDQDENGATQLNTSIYTYSSTDIINRFFVGNNSNVALEVSALFATDSQMIATYDTSQRAGIMNLMLDKEQESNINLSAVEGSWDTVDSETFINNLGGFIGFNKETSCRWEGELSAMSNTLMALEIHRENCTEFNGDAKGFALIDGEGDIHFLAEKSTRLLWMRFEPVAPTTPTATPDTEETETEDPQTAEI